MKFSLASPSTGDRSLFFFANISTGFISFLVSQQSSRLVASNAVPLCDTERQASSVREESNGGEKGLDSDSFNCFFTGLGVMGLILVVLCTR